MSKIYIAILLIIGLHVSLCCDEFKSIQTLIEKVKNIPDKSPLSEIEAASIFDYTTGHYSDINGLLRSIPKTILDESNWSIDELIKHQYFNKDPSTFFDGNCNLAKKSAGCYKLNEKDCEAKRQEKYKTCIQSKIDYLSYYGISKDDKMGKYMRFIQCIMTSMSKLPIPDSKRVQRAYATRILPKNEGSIYKESGFLSFTYDLKFNFIKFWQNIRSAQMFRVELSDKTLGRDVSKYSNVPSEKEILFPPFTKICLQNIITKTYFGVPISDNIGVESNDMSTRDIIYGKEVPDDNCIPSDVVYQSWPSTKVDKFEGFGFNGLVKLNKDQK